MQQFLKNIADAAWFQNFITVVILAAGVVVGLETYPELVEKHEGLFHSLNWVILIIFIIEVVVKMGAEAPRIDRYFYDPWNVFDFLIVVACLLPFGGSSVAVLRLLRLLRVLKLVNAVPKLQVLVNALLKAIPSMVYVSIFLLLLFYVYACAAVFMFGDNDPVHFENLQIALLSLFRVVTFEDWTDVMYIQMMGCEEYYGSYNQDVNMTGGAVCDDPHAYGVWGALFFVSFVMIGTNIVLNLFIGVVMNGMDEAKKEQEIRMALESGEIAMDVESGCREIEDQLESIRETLKSVREMAGANAADSGSG